MYKFNNCKKKKKKRNSNQKLMSVVHFEKCYNLIEESTDCL